jgi:hypothetical protein
MSEKMQVAWVRAKLSSFKSTAKRTGVPFDPAVKKDLQELYGTTSCPYTSCKILWAHGRPLGAWVIRKVRDKGYIPGNIVMCEYRFAHMQNFLGTTEAVYSFCQQVATHKEHVEGPEPHSL